MQQKGKQKHKISKGMFHNETEELQRCMIFMGKRDLWLVQDLVKHLRITMQEEKKIKADIPAEPPTSLSKRRQTQIDGTVTAEVRALDKKYF